MDVIWTPSGVYRRAAYSSEADLEAAILRVQAELFGPNRIYLDVKKKVGHNIPDGYLIDLNGPKPRLYVVENELAIHDALRHIAVQILQFSLAFESEQRLVKSILFEAIQHHPEAKSRCEQYAATYHFGHLEHLLTWLIYEAPFTALVIIDEMPDALENVLLKKFRFGVEVLELARYTNEQGEHWYRFEPFLADLSQDIAVAAGNTGGASGRLTMGDVDTVVVPAREEGFQAVFLGEQRWYEIRVHGSMRPQIKYIAGYQVAPISAITHIAPVQSIEPWQDSNRFVVTFAEPAREIGPIPLIKGGRVKGLQSLRYTNHERLEAAKTLDDIW